MEAYGPDGGPCSVMAAFVGVGALCYTIGNGPGREALYSWAAAAALLAVGKGREWRNLDAARRQLEL
jgi:hypothetical protein